MSRLSESKEKFIEELKERGAKAGKEAAEVFEYEPLWRLNKAIERGDAIVELEHLLSVMDLDAEEVFGDEWKDERDEPEFIEAWIAAVVGSLETAE